MQVYKCDSCGRDIENDDRYRYDLSLWFHQHPNTTPQECKELCRNYCLPCGKSIHRYILKRDLPTECEEGE